MSDQEILHVIQRGVLYELRSEPEGGYTINVALLPGCFSFGETIDEALRNVQEAIALWIEGAAELGFDVPQPFALKQAS